MIMIMMIIIIIIITIIIIIIIILKGSIGVVSDLFKNFSILRLKIC